jgi:hypothetical protein
MTALFAYISYGTPRPRSTGSRQPLPGRDAPLRRRRDSAARRAQTRRRRRNARDRRRRLLRLSSRSAATSPTGGCLSLLVRRTRVARAGADQIAQLRGALVPAGCARRKQTDLSHQRPRGRKTSKVHRPPITRRLLTEQSRRGKPPNINTRCGRGFRRGGPRRSLRVQALGGRGPSAAGEIPQGGRVHRHHGRQNQRRGRGSARREPGIMDAPPTTRQYPATRPKRGVPSPPRELLCVPSAVVVDQAATHRLGPLRGVEVALSRRDDRSLHQDVPRVSEGDGIAETGFLG